jgi:hypothetical protein
LYGVTAGPIAIGTGADGERHADAFAGVEARAAHFGEVPARSEIACAPFGVGFEPTAGEHDGSAFQLTGFIAAFEADAGNTHAVVNKIGGARAVANFDTVLLARRAQHVDKTRSAADRLHRQTAPEFELAFDLEGLPAIDRYETDALFAHPDQR